MGSSGLEPRPARRRTRVSRTREPVSQSGDSCASADEDVECVCLRVRGFLLSWRDLRRRRRPPCRARRRAGKRGRMEEEEEEGHP